MKQFSEGVEMKRQFWKGLFLSFVVLCMWALSISAQTDLQKITVRVPGATIHVTPVAESEVIESPSVGSVYEVVRKAGEWYEIKLPSRMGMVITGWIHEKYLNIEKPAAAPEKDVVQMPVKVEPKQPPRARSINISLAGLYHRQMGYDYRYAFLYSGETGAIYDSTDDQNAFGVRLGVGLFVIENIEIELGFQYAAATLKGLYALDWPNDSLYYDIAHAEASAKPKISEMMFNLGLNFHVLTGGPLRPYLGGGVSYINGKVKLLEDIVYLETWYSDTTHEIEITDLKFSSETISILGFYGKAGLDVAISESVAFFGEGQYLIAKKQVPHPLATAISGEKELMEIDVGGISALFGIKMRF